MLLLSFSFLLLLPLSLMEARDVGSVDCASTSSCSSSPTLPTDKLIVGYPTWGQCDDSILTQVRSGVNVVIWFAINLAKDSQTQGPVVTGGPDYGCVATIVGTLRQEGYTNVTHMISVGGWDAPHVDTSFTAQQWWDTWFNWNRNISRPDLGFYGFDGIDWDLEGNDDPKSPYNNFTVQQLDLVGQLSQLAKQHHYLVSMAPPQSYMDCDTTQFDLSLLHAPDWKPTFAYQGHNAYSFLLAKYKTTLVTTPSALASSASSHQQTLVEVPTFDFVSIQLYEGWSRAGWQISSGTPATQYLEHLIGTMNGGWKVDFASDPLVGLPTQQVSVPATQLVIGLANGWAADLGGKVLLIWPSTDIQYQELTLKPRGFMFWDLKDEGKMVNGKAFVMVKELLEMYGK